MCVRQNFFDLLVTFHYEKYYTFVCMCVCIYINLLKMKCNLLLKGISPYRAVNTFHYGYKNQSVNDV